jgi:hypothetical protein
MRRSHTEAHYVKVPLAAAAAAAPEWSARPSARRRPHLAQHLNGVVCVCLVGAGSAQKQVSREARRIIL